MNTFKPIITKRLELRKLNMNDKEDLFKYRSLPEVYKFQGFKPNDINEIDDFINNIANYPNIPNTWFQLGVFIKNKQSLIGDIGIHFLEDNAQVEIGYTLSPSYQGKGYAVEAVRSVINYLFFDLKKHRVIASLSPKNLKSIRLLEKLKMRKEAHFIKSFLEDDKWYDDCIYAVLEEEWKVQYKEY